jgi:mannose-1-phosphate guanylyltransferase
MTVLSADAWIGDNIKFLNDLNKASDCATKEHGLVTIGIRPTYPETGYGYIETDEKSVPMKVKSFREKPGYEQAVEYLNSGNYYWNTGIFVWTIKDFRAQLLEHCPEIIRPLDGWISAGADLTDLSLIYNSLPKLSIDCALMEKSKRVVLLPASFLWSDVGSWSAVAEFYKADSFGNVVTGGDAVLVESKNCAVFGGSRLIAISGLSDVIVVDEPDTVLICHKRNAQNVKIIVDKLKGLSREDLL